MILKKRNRLSLIFILMLAIVGVFGGAMQNTAEAGSLGRRIIKEELRKRPHSGHVRSLDDKRKVHERIKERRRKVKEKGGIENRRFTENHIGDGHKNTNLIWR